MASFLPRFNQLSAAFTIVIAPYNQDNRTTGLESHISQDLAVKMSEVDDYSKQQYPRRWLLPSAIEPGNLQVQTRHGL
jgi:hypothetical protein